MHNRDLMWAYANSGAYAHAFVESSTTVNHRQALCNSRIMLPDGTVFVSYLMLGTDPTCPRCERKFKEARDALPKNPNIQDNATVGGRIGPRVVVSGNGHVGPLATAYGDARVSENGCLRGRSSLRGAAHVSGHADLFDDVTVGGNAQVRGWADLFQDVDVTDEAVIEGSAQLMGYVTVSGNARIHGRANVGGCARIGRDADVFLPQHVVVITGFGQDSITLYRTTAGHRMLIGCQSLTLDDDLKELARDHDWPLPPHWDAMAETLRKIADDWHGSNAPECTRSCCYQMEK